ncbi:sirohydrochlorin chelatase [Chitinimonas sp.]|uniref:sirohydrochlorin chelatase n=1 Tax=Chitinimonas sp. TaxID=1934313 RepID=UPI0035AF4791
MTSAIIVFAHGARDPQWAGSFQQLRERLQAQLPTHTIRLAFLELMTPSLEDCVADLAAAGVLQLTIIPAFMARGAHLRRDLPELVDTLRMRFPQLHIKVSEALGEAAPIQQAMVQWIADELGE